MGEPENAPPHWLNSHFAKAGNRLRFDRFMELCLYDEKNGYYAQNITSVGAIGDFSPLPFPHFSQIPFRAPSRILTCTTS